MHILIKKALIVSVSLLAVTACDSASKSSNTAEPENRKSEIVIAGSTFAQPFFNKALAVYGAVHPDVKLAYRSVGSGAGIEQFIGGEADIGTTDSPISDSEANAVEGGVYQVLATAGMIAIGYNLPGVNSPLNLPRDVYPDIFLGKITRWDDPRIIAANPGVKLPSAPIQVLARSDSSGTTYAFTTHLAAVSERWKNGPGVGKVIGWPSTPILLKGNEGVAHRLKITHHAISYIEAGFAQRLGLNLARLQNRAGELIWPSVESGQRGLLNGSDSAPVGQQISIADPEGAGSYPIVTYTWALLRKDYGDSEKSLAVRSFMRWILDDGQELAQSLSYVPLPQSLAQSAMAKISHGGQVKN